MAQWEITDTKTGIVHIIDSDFRPSAIERALIIASNPEQYEHVEDYETRFTIKKIT